MDICRKCGSEFEGNYCPDCGHPLKLERINGRYILSEIGSVLNFQKGILYTIKELLIRPGQNIRAFISEDRNRLVKPIMFILITSLIYTILVSIFHFEDGYVSYSDDKESTTLIIFKWVQGNYGYANIIMSIFIGLWLKILFRKYPFNFYEIIILLCFVMGIGMLIYSAFGIVQGLTHINLMQFGAIIGLVYTTYAIGQFFEKRKLLSYVKAFFAYLLGMLTFTLIAIGTGIFIDLIK
ncbi:MAG: hypothetical protein CVT99_12650 [Bacteroidetes bacterium HGW-Bacteroidetes-16]|jgi:hypothetical protein|nr:MAG: hypothetical protein CVT99_12650 [Bacteroidetes bacterium HGW-Bacteroidetes-16]